MASRFVHHPSVFATRRTKILVLRMLLVAGALAGLLGCAPEGESQADENGEGHPLIGVVQAVDGQRNEMTVAHEEIPGVMPPMTMVFRVGPGDVKVFAEGDRIRARMVRDEDGGFRLVKIWKIDEAAAREMRKANERLAERLEELGSGYYLGEGDALPDFGLLDQYSRPVRPEQFAGKPFVMNFVFTRCTDGEMCPLSTSKMARLQRLAREAGLEELQFVSVSLDPEFDTPGVLRAYADSYGIDGDNFYFVTGERAAARQLIRGMGVSRFEGDETIFHSLATVLVGPDGTIRLRSEESGWDPEAFLRAATELVERSDAGA